MYLRNSLTYLEATCHLMEQILGNKPQLIKARGTRMRPRCEDLTDVHHGVASVSPGI